MSDGPATRALRRWLPVLRGATGVAILAILITRIPTDEVRDQLPDASVATAVWLFVALLGTAAALVLSARRWQQVLRALEIDIGLGRVFNVYAAGLFLSNVLPSTIGGDVLRIHRLGRQTNDSPTVFASVAIERLSGWVVLPLFTLVGLALSPGLLGERAWLALIIAVVTLSLLMLVLWAAEHPQVGGRVLGDSSARQFLGAVHLGLGRLRRHPEESGKILFVASIYQITLVASAAVAGHAIGIEVSLIGWLTVIPLVLIIQVIPLSISGFGVREGALVLFLGPLGVGTGQAILLGLLLYSLTLVVSLSGAPAFALGDRPRATAATR